MHVLWEVKIWKITIVSTNDISANQKVCNMGGAYKNCDLPCFYCSIHDSEILDYCEGGDEAIHCTTDHRSGHRRQERMLRGQPVQG